MVKQLNERLPSPFGVFSPGESEHGDDIAILFIGISIILDKTKIIS